LTFFAWFYMIFKGRNPYHDFNSKAVRAYERATAYAYLLTSDYPAFSLDEDPDYPIVSQLEQVPLVRMKVLFRLILMIPVCIVWFFLGYGLALLAFVSWITLLIRGTLPKPLHNAIAAIVRFIGRMNAYVLLLQDPYPWGLFGDKTSPAESTAHDDGAHAEHDSAPISPPVVESTFGGPSSSQELSPYPSPSTSLESDSASSTPSAWTMAVSTGAKWVIALSLIFGIPAGILWVAFAPSFNMQPNLSGSISAASWSRQYRGDVVSFRSAIVGDLSVFDATNPNWTTLLNDCVALQSKYQVFEYVPYYPQSGINQNLISGLSTIYTSLNNCATIIAPYKVTKAVPGLAQQLSVGSTNLETFLQQSKP
jgi:Domain of unknown function (DUF4389)